ncbi:hypothetical protein LTR70_007892 [Exophiala xenobiotica]|uniref:Kinesin n=1 Tax=Lithohypha guttulata TaxID=1690604 RepID=A0ABR0K8F0_9EURO|nr:hypothetical protein LTR24_005568 [Lithohypha guttulata]KAK5312897.1 hypothetical protein LTR70_007892 [Exophiala xenobiotica]
MAPTGGGNIKVVVRVRPFNNRELDRNAQCVVHMSGAQTLLTPPTDASHKNKADLQKTFKYDKSYWSFRRNDPHYAGQDTLFADLGDPLLDNAFQGYNNCIFAYGQTGSGKSYSMMGYGDETGIIPRICKVMFDKIDHIQSADPNVKCTVEVSYLEIYNERVRDLLNPASKGNLRVREHPSTGPYVEDLAKLAVQSFPEIENLMDEGNKARTVAATNMNETSSRSHAVFTLTLTQKRHDVETNMVSEKVAKISLVDLAGSERATSTGATGARLKEGAEINRSLSTLGRVIAALADLSSGKKNLKVPYRDSVLTWLLKDSLGGNSMTAMIAAISPADINFEETLSTLRYADSAKRIKNHAVVNEDPNARMIRELKEELAQLRSKLGGGGTIGAPGQPVEVYPEGTPMAQQMVSITQADGSIKKVSKAEIMDQLSQSEKLYKDLNQTWEEKLLMTEEIHKEREAALEELGISIEKGNVGMSTPKKMPHLVNLSDDPLLAECLVYNLKPGITTVGNVESSDNSEIRLNGSRILEHHCKLENVDNVVSIIPNEGAAIMVNGIRVDKPKRLRSGNRIILGDFHIFRFNNPLEAKAERAEQSQSLLRHSVTASQMGSPMPYRPRHERSTSSTTDIWEDSSRAGSPMPADADWAFARREAAGAILGVDTKVNELTDEQLNSLYENILKAREERRGGRPDSTVFEHDDSSDDMSSFLVRDKYMSEEGTLDEDYSMDTTITMPQQVPPTPSRTISDCQHPGQESDHDKSAEPSQSQSPNVDEETQQKQAEMMRQELERTKREFHEELRRQKEEYEAQIQAASVQPPGPIAYSELTPQEKAIARIVVETWRQRNYVRIAEAILQNSGLLKEAQVISRLLEQESSFQFCVLDLGQEKVSSYDLILSDISDDDDNKLADMRKPCLAVRVIDLKNNVIRTWSLDKLNARVLKMRQMLQYKDQPEYLQHFRLSNPFTDADGPMYSLLGDCSIPLTAAFETRVQDYALDVISPFSRQVLGRLRMSLEPSVIEAPLGMVKFNIVLRDLAGFAEHEGSELHAQMFVTGSQEESVVTSSPISDFGDGPIRFESIHGLSVAHASEKSSMLKVAIYAKVSSMHLDKLISWDELREMAEHPPGQTTSSRLPESEFSVEERHDVFAKVQILELAENGQYMPVEAVLASNSEPGIHQLHQGLQRRISVSLTYSLSGSLPWDDIRNLRVSDIHLLDSLGRVTDASTTTPEIPLKQTQEPMIRDNADGTSNITFTGQWDSSLHKSLNLDRATGESNRVRVNIKWDIISSRLAEPMTFALDQFLQVQSRSYLRPQSILKSFWNQQRVTRSADGVFSIVVRPLSAKRAADLWRLDTGKDYINGEELLGSWTPRGISLVKDYITARRKRRQLEDIEAAKAIHGARKLNISAPRKSRDPSPLSLDEATTKKREDKMKRFLTLWQKRNSDMSNPIFDDTESAKPAATASFRAQQAGRTQRYAASVTHHPKNPTSLKSGYLLMPSETLPDQHSQATMQWKRRFVDLRTPYLHIHEVPSGDGINAINLSRARIDHDPDFKRLLGGVSAKDEDASNTGTSTSTPRKGHSRGKSTDLNHGLGHVFAVYGEQNTFLFAARGERVKSEWILKIDQGCFLAEDGLDAEGDEDGEPVAMATGEG